MANRLQIKHKMTTAKLHVLLPLVAALAIAGCGGGGGGDAQPTATNPTATTSGKAVDGYLSGSTVFCDTNGNGLLNAGETRTTTDIGGNFTFSPACASTIVVAGGTDTATGYPFKGLLKAAPGSSVVTPLTSVLAQSGLTAAQLSSALGLPAGIDITQVDPMTNTALLRQTLAVQQILQQVANTFGSLTSPGEVPAHYAKVAKALGDLLVESPNSTLFTADGKVNATLVSGAVGKAVQAINTGAASPVAFTAADVAAVATGIATQTEKFLQAPDADLTNVAKQLQNPLNPPIATETALTNYIYPAHDSIWINDSQVTLAQFASSSGAIVTGLDTIALAYAAKGTPEINTVVDVAMSLEETAGKRVLQVKVAQVRVKRSSADGLVTLEMLPETEVHIFAQDSAGSNFNVTLKDLSFNPISIVHNAVTVKYSDLVNKVAASSHNSGPFSASQFAQIQGRFKVRLAVSSNLNVRMENGALPTINVGIYNPSNPALEIYGVTGPGIEGFLSIN